jgi:hypothetical protein
LVFGLAINRAGIRYFLFFHPFFLLLNRLENAKNFAIGAAQKINLVFGGVLGLSEEKKWFFLRCHRLLSSLDFLLLHGNKLLVVAGFHWLFSPPSHLDS